MQNAPRWKLKSLGRHMNVIFVSKGADASLLCADPTCRYFLFSGGLVPSAITAEAVPSVSTAISLDTNNQLRWFDAQNAPTLRHMKTTSSQQATSSDRDKEDTRQPHHHHHPAACGSGTLERLESSTINGSWVDSARDVSDAGITAYDSSIGSSQPPAHQTPKNGKPGAAKPGNHNTITSRGNVYGIKEKLCSFHPPAPENCEGLSTSDAAGTECPSLQPGHVLDIYLHETVDAPGNKHRNISGVDEGGDKSFLLLPESSSTAAPGVEEKKDTGSRWRLDARHASCIGKVSCWLLQELEAEEPLREIDQMVMFLRTTEVSRISVRETVLREDSVLYAAGIADQMGWQP